MPLVLKYIFDLRKAYETEESRVQEQFNFARNTHTVSIYVEIKVNAHKYFERKKKRELCWI